MRFIKKMLVRLLLIAILLLCGCTAGKEAPAPAADAPSPFATATTAENAFAKADKPRAFAFPRDHGAHPEYQTEWWYYTGHLRTAEGRAFGLQVTFFRRALVADAPARTSNWGAKDIYMAHFCISDLQSGTFYQSERVARGAADLAGASLDGHDVHLLDWSIAPHETGVKMQLADVEAEMGIDLVATEPAVVVLHGESPGLSLKGGPGQASYYYSLPRFPARGQLTVGDRTFEVNGDLWMDHEFGSNQLGPEQQGWDWFALQLDDGSAVMLFQIRPTDPTGNTVLSGTWIAPDGTSTLLSASDIRLAGRSLWTSPNSGGQYPQEWRIAIPRFGVEATVTSRMPNQELHTEGSTGITYWEGAVSVSGSHTGEGYLEMTGYVENIGARF